MSYISQKNSRDEPSRHNLNREMLELADVKMQINLIDVYKPFH